MLTRAADRFEARRLLAVLDGVTAGAVQAFAGADGNAAHARARLERVAYPTR